MIKVIYDPIYGVAIPDGEVIEFSHSLHDRVITISNGIVLDAIRLAIKEGKYKPEDIYIEFEGKRININKDGRAENWPEGFCDTWDRILGGLTGWG